METTFSIIMPVYNVEKYLEESIESILNQTCASLELLIINDGSTDKSRLIAEKFLLKDQRVKIFDKKNGGASSARNIGIEHAIGEYLYFMDSDDLLNKNALQIIKDKFTERDIDLILFTAKPFFDPGYLVGTNKQLEESEIYYGRNTLPEGDYSAKEYFESTAQENKFVASVCLFATRRKIITEAGLKFHEGIMCEDELFTRNLLFRANTVNLLKVNLYKRRIRHASVSTSENAIYKAGSILVIAEKLQLLSKEFHNSQLSKDVEYFYKLAIETLLSIEKSSAHYHEAIRKLFSSPLSSLFGLSRKDRILLKHKHLKLLKKQWASLRYNIGLRTRIKEAFN